MLRIVRYCCLFLPLLWASVSFAQATVSELIRPSVKGSHAQLISVERGKELNRNYNEKMALLNRGEPLDDANAIWYSLEELETYIAYIKKEGAAKGYEVNGIRFYFGSYPITEKNGKAGYTTLFLSPTGRLATEGPRLNSLQVLRKILPS